jgi:Tfp pilus assembly protein PilF
MIAPVDLAALYPLRHSFPYWMTLGSAVFLIASTAVSLRLREKFPYVLVGWLWFVGTLIPVIGLVQAGDQALADRFFYVPGIGLFLALVWGVADLLSRWSFPVSLGRAAAAAILVALSLSTIRQAAHWRNSAALWTHALAVTTDNHRAENLIGNEFFKAGDIRRAMEHYSEAIRINPKFADAHNGRGSVFESQNSLDSAYAEYMQAIAINPRMIEVHNNLGNIFLDAGSVAEAASYYRKGLAIAPDSPELHTGLGAALSAEGKYDDALAQFLEALKLRPDADAEFNVGVTYAELKQPQLAASHLDAALRLNPGHEQARKQLDALRK